MLAAGGEISGRARLPRRDIERWRLKPTGQQQDHRARPTNKDQYRQRASAPARYWRRRPAPRQLEHRKAAATSIGHRDAAPMTIGTAEAGDRGYRRISSGKITLPKSGFRARFHDLPGFLRRGHGRELSTEQDQERHRHHRTELVIPAEGPSSTSTNRQLAEGSLVD